MRSESSPSRRCRFPSGSSVRVRASSHSVASLLSTRLDAVASISHGATEPREILAMVLHATRSLCYLPGQRWDDRSAPLLRLFLLSKRGHLDPRPAIGAPSANSAHARTARHRPRPRLEGDGLLRAQPWTQPSSESSASSGKPSASAMAQRHTPPPHVTATVRAMTSA